MGSGVRILFAAIVEFFELANPIGQSSKPNPQKHPIDAIGQKPTCELQLTQ